MKNDPNENLSFENELLELRLMAEFGAVTHREGQLSPEMENQFLKNVLEFERSFCESKETTVSEFLGNPSWMPSSEISELLIDSKLDELIEFLRSKNIYIDFGGSYDSLTKYKFITEELMEEIIFPNLGAGMTMNFNYEDFHPDHQVELERKTAEFIADWFAKDYEELNLHLADQVILPCGSKISKHEVTELINTMFDCYSSFSEGRQVISNVSFEVIDDVGIALAEGTVHYNAVIAGKEAIAIQGPFKLYYSLEYGWWDVSYFVFPGFNYSSE